MPNELNTVSYGKPLDFLEFRLEWRDGTLLNNQVICGTVNAGRAAFKEGVQDLASFIKRFPAAVSALITARVVLDDARDAVLSRGGIKSVIAVA